MRVCLLLALVVGTHTAAAASWTYADRVLNQTQWDTVIDAAAAEILHYASYDEDCGVLVAYEASDVNGPPGSAALDLPARLDPAQHPRLTRNVFSTEAARLSCSGYWPCHAVQTFTLPGTSALVAVYYGRMETTDLTAYGNLLDSGGDEEVDYTRWVATVVLDRLQGYACPIGSEAIDAEWFYTTWAGRFTDTLMDVTEYLGVAADAVLTPADIATVSPQIETYFNTFGHAHRMWPTPNCSLTPILRRPDTGCVAAACAPNTICPSGYRVRSDEWGLCLAGATGSGDATQHVVTGDPTLDADAETIFWSGAGASVQATATSIYNLLHLTEFGSHLPCGADTGRGQCVHPWSTATAALSSTSAFGDPWCACTGIQIPVSGDPSCQFDGAETLRLGAELDDPGDCVHPELGLICSLAGDCVYDEDAIQWGALDITGGGDVVSCDCDPPFTGNACQSTLCDAGPANGGDCHTAGRGLCEADAGAPGGYSCTCNPPFYGDACQYIDAGQAGNTTALECYIVETEIEDPPGTLTAGEWTLCSGRGDCSQTGSVGVCTCNAGYIGDRCEYVDCDHETDCGRLGACIQGTDRFGRAETTCRCAVHAADDGVALGGLVGTDDDATCDADLCVQGTYSPTTEPIDGVFTIEPRGTCDCITETREPDEELTYVEVVGDQSIPRHTWLPTLYRVNASNPGGDTIPYIPNIYIGNTGDTCAEPICPLYVDPEDGSPASIQCGVTEQVLPHVCTTCEDFPDLGLCRFTTGFGGLCDCNGTRALAIAIEAAANDGDPETDPDALGPYYFEVGMARYEDNPDPDNPMCTPYCRNGGSWDPVTRRCVCGGTAYRGDTCEEYRCAHGTWTEDAVGDCTYCDPGWGVVPDCDACQEGYTGDDCDECVTGWYRPVPGGACVQCQDTAGCNTVPGATLAAACPDFIATTDPTCICGAGYTGDLCGDCADGYRGYSFLPGQCFECTPALLGCDDTGSSSVLCLSSASSPSGLAVQQCVCTHELLISATCDACAEGFAKSGASCVSCVVALGCNALGTLDADCPTGRDVSNDPGAHCTCRDGYTGDTCNDCDTAAGYVSSGGICTRCDHDCGVYGYASCDTGTPTCVCTHGRMGAACDTCDPDECGPHGTCAGNATHPADTWCTCDAGYAVNPVVAAGDPDNAHTLPCDSCADTGYFSPTTQQHADRYPPADVGDCLSITDECGAIVDVNATVAAGVCTCPLGFAAPTADTAWACATGVCADGYVGPDCAPCPACPEGAACSWTGAAATCSCTNGFIGEACNQCPDATLARPVGVSSSLVPDACTPCPDCGTNGTCAWTQGYVAGCLCIAPTAHAVRGDVTSPCSGCVPGRSPLTCGPCPNCAYGEVCTETSPGVTGCACRDGTRRVYGHKTPGVHPCVASAVADTVEAIHGIDLTAWVDSITTAGASVGDTVTPPAARPVYALAPAEDFTLGSIAAIVTAAGVAAFVVGAGVAALVWGLTVGFGAGGSLKMGARATTPPPPPPPRRQYPQEGAPLLRRNRHPATTIVHPPA